MRLTQAGIAVLAAAALAGCGGGDAPVAAPTQARPLADCTPLEPGVNDRFLLCRRSGPRDRGGFSFRGRGPIPIAYPTRGPAGHWSGGFLSPDRQTLLAQWTAECEVPFAFFVPARGGPPRLVTGERLVEDARPSIAHGWTRDGEAIVELLPGCSDARPGGRTALLLISPDGAQRRLRGSRP